MKSYALLLALVTSFSVSADPLLKSESLAAAMADGLSEVNNISAVSSSVRDSIVDLDQGGSITVVKVKKANQTLTYRIETNGYGEVTKSELVDKK